MAVSTAMTVIPTGYRSAINFQINCIVSIHRKRIGSRRGDIDLPCKYSQVVIIGTAISSIERIAATVDSGNGLGTTQIGSDRVSKD